MMPKVIQLHYYYMFIQVLIAFALHRGIIVIPKSANPERIQSNYEAQKITLDNVDMEKLYGLEKNHHFLRFFIKKNQTLDDFWDVEYDKNYVVNGNHIVNGQ